MFAVRESRTLLENKDLDTRPGDSEPASGPAISDELLSNLGQEGLLVGLRHQFPGQLRTLGTTDSWFWRALGQRWASRIMPAQLKELMRHASMETTLRYYVGTNAERTADACWEAYERACTGRTY
jgi:putative heme degradation protein